MRPVLGKVQALLIGAVAGFPVGYLQGRGVLNVVGLVRESPVEGVAGQAYAFVTSAMARYGIWAYAAASVMKGVLLFFIIPAETVTPLYVLQAAETPLQVALIAVVGAAAITASNFVVYLLSRLAGERFFEPKDTATWRFMNWLVLKHGRLSMYFLRVIPWIGGWAAIPAGIAGLNARTFLIYSFLGFLTYESILGFAAYYGLKAGTGSVPLLPLLLG